MNLAMELNSRALACGCRTVRCTNTRVSELPSRHVSRSLQRHGLSKLHTSKHSRTRLSAASNGDTAQVADGKQRLSIDLEPQAEGEYCMPGEVSLDNESHKDFTILRVEVKDYPGLLRVIAWVINGLELVVQNARLKTQKDGTANNTFWITTDGGRKLDLKRAELVAERVGDFVIYCTPNQHAVEAQEFQEGPIYLSNKEHDEYSVVSVVSEPNQKGFLLELASAMTGLGVTIHDAIIQGTSDIPEDNTNFANGIGSRLFKFWVTDRRGDKLDYPRCTALIYTMGLLIGKSNAPLRPPGSSLATIGDSGASPLEL